MIMGTAIQAMTTRNNSAKGRSINAVTVSEAGDPVRLRLTLLAARLRVTVWDRSAHAPLLERALPDDEGGRGLWLVDSLSTSWGWAREPQGGKYVWCEYLCAA